MKEEVMKEIVGKTQIIHSHLSYHIKKVEFPEENHIANEFNGIFINIGINLAQKIPKSLKSFESHLQ